ncbi:MAG: 30S ribosomal protein S7 [Candidatus Brocadiales bacterium]
MGLEYRSTAVFLKPDVRYNSKLASKVINGIMRKGKKSTAERIFYAAMDFIKKKVQDKEPIEVLEMAVNNVKPLVEVRSRRIGGATYQVPVEVPRKRQTSLAIRWILQAAKAKKGRPMHRKLAEELMDGYRRQGTAYTKRENTHKMAEANKAFAHFTW